MDSSLLQTSLLENTAQGAGSQIVARFARDSDAPWFAWMLELPVTAPSGHQEPAILGQQSEDFADFHVARLAGGGGDSQSTMAPRRGGRHAAPSCQRSLPSRVPIYGRSLRCRAQA